MHRTPSQTNSVVSLIGMTSQERTAKRALVLLHNKTPAEVLRALVVGAMANRCLVVARQVRSRTSMRKTNQVSRSSIIKRRPRVAEAL